jgi:hypothetical protein
VRDVGIHSGVQRIEILVRGRFFNSMRRILLSIYGFLDSSLSAWLTQSVGFSPSRLNFFGRPIAP